jgi:hypothetical protein
MVRWIAVLLLAGYGAAVGRSAGFAGVWAGSGDERERLDNMCDCDRTDWVVTRVRHGRSDLIGRGRVRKLQRRRSRIR